MARGRKKRPTIFHVLNGTDRPCRRNEEEPQPDIPDILQDPPDFLSESAKKEWYSMGNILHNAGLLTELDYSAFKKYCIAEGHIVDAAVEMGDKFTVFGAKGTVVQNPLMAIINKSMEISHRFLIEYGMTPSSRTKIKGNKPRKKINRFAENRKHQVNQ